MWKSLSVRHPFFRPAWRRMVTTAFVGCWTLFELWTGSVFWTILFGAVSVYCIYEFYIAFDPSNYEDRDG